MQGFNMGRYVPPEYEGSLSANQVSGKHALGSRARKAAQGILTVRFEMPFGVWCGTCPKPTIIGQGVRFNAEKRKVGNYYSTPIWAFRMKHADCGGWIEIRTDPKNTEYVVFEGGKQRDTGEGRLHEGDMEIKTEEERQRLREDAFAALEVTIDDRKQALTDKHRIEELYEAQDRHWSDTYAANRRLRKTFRAERKDLEKKAATAEQLKDKMSLGIDLLDESEADRIHAAQINFGIEADHDNQDAIVRAQGRGLFGSHASPSGQSSSKGATADKTAQTRQKLRSELSRNTRASLDVFGAPTQGISRGSLPGLKRKRASVDEEGKSDGLVDPRAQPEKSGLSLVGYESD